MSVCSSAHTDTVKCICSDTHLICLYSVTAFNLSVKSYLDGKRLILLTSVGWYFLSLSAQLVVLTAGDPLFCSRSPQGPCQMLTGVGSHTAAHGELFMT